MPLAFAITETMRGVHHFVDPARGPATDRRFDFVIDWGAPIRTSLNPLSDAFMVHEASGDVFVEGLTPSRTACSGTLAIDYFRKHTITYSLDFEAEGATFHYVGDKTDVRLLRPLQLIKTHTTCYGTITDAHGKIVSRSVVHFPPDTMVAFLRSLRLLNAR